MANKKISELVNRTPSLTDLMLVGDPSSGYSYKCTITELSTLLEANVSLNDLNDVIISTPTNGQVLTYNGTNWVNGNNGITEINGLTAASQSFAVGTSGTDFAIVSSTSTHTFNLPTASATNRGALSSTDWSTFNNKIGGSGTTNYVSKFTASGTIGNSAIQESSGNTAINGTIISNADFRFLTVYGNAAGFGGVFQSRTSNNSVVGNFYTDSNGVWFGAGSTSPILFNIGVLEVMRFDTSGNAGIGIAAPAAKLDVNGDLKLATIVNATTDTDRFLVSDSGVIKYRTGAELLSDIGGASSSSVSGTTNYVAKFTGTNAVGNSQIFDNGTNVGIGTISGGAKLEIYDASTNSILRFNSGTNNSLRGLEWYNNNTSNIYGSIKSDYTSGVFTYDAGASVYAGTHVFRIGTGGEAMRIDASGNLGLGTSSPIEKFTSNGLIAVTGASATAYYVGNNNAGFFDYNSGDSRIGSQSSAGSSRITFYTTSSGYTGITERMRLDASGNLGLGVTPSAWGSGYTAFQIGTTGQFVYVTNSLFNINNAYYNGTNWIYQTNGYSNVYEINKGDGANKWYTAPSGTAGNTISFTQAMTLDASGRLGIGTSSPDVILHVSGTTGTAKIASTSTTAANYPYLTFLHAGNDEFRIGGGDGLRFLSSGTSERMRITSGGLVGIGTSSPIDKLNIVGGATFTSSISAPTNTNIGSLQIGYDGTNGVIRTWNSSPMVFNTAGVDRLYITSGGNIGIGVTPSAWTVFNPILQIKTGSLAGSGTANFRMFANTYYDGSYKYIGTGTATQYEQDGYHAWYTAPSGTAGNAISFSERMRITSGGDVGIGVTSPGAKLEVNGAIKTAAPSTDAAKPWKLGGVTFATVSLNTGAFITVEIDGTSYQLALAQ